MPRVLGMVCVLMLAACTSKPVQPEKAKFEGVRTIALLDVREPSQHMIYNYISPLTALGVTGELLKEADLDFQREDFNTMLRGQNLLVGKLLTDRVAEYLTSMGYSVVRLPDTRGPNIESEWTDGWMTEGRPQFDPATLDVKADAVLDLRIVRSGYISTVGVNAYSPALSVEAVLYGRPSNQPIYHVRIAYGAQPFWGEKALVPASNSYKFGSYAKLMRQPEIAAEGLRAGANLVAGRVIQDFPWAYAANKKVVSKP
ncbi:MAG TPA: hypothetical protein VL381_01945 [Rhodocyclaceae bacterium]|nr:hypothetical protein [Rhodocyclaceae bacterium]